MRVLHRSGKAAFMLAAGLASGAFAANDSDHTGTITISESIVINAAPRTVWATVRDFDAIGFWNPQVKSSNITAGNNDQPGAKRHLTLAGGGSINEQLLAWNAQKMRYTYRMIAGDLPVSHYRATIAVKPKGDEKAILIWEGQFKPDSTHTRRAVRRFYRAGLLQVQAILDTGKQTQPAHGGPALPNESKKTTSTP